MKSKITIALAGNPNSGKTTMFNNIVGVKEHVGNWPGVTVEKKSGNVRQGDTEIEVVDLPGTYSLTAFSMEEIVARNFIVDEQPDVVVNVVDASNLERNLYLTLQLRELGARVVVALNMWDIAQKRGIRINTSKLEILLGVAVVPTVASKSEGTAKLLEKAIFVAGSHQSEDLAPIHYNRELEDHLAQLVAIITKSSSKLSDRYGAKWLALKALEGDKVVLEKLAEDPVWPDFRVALVAIERHLRDIFDDEPDSVIADGRYGFITGAVREAVKRSQENRRSLSDRIDQVVTNKLLGLPIFFFAMWLTFKLTFTIGEIPMGWLEILFEWTAGLFDPMTDGALKSLLVDGIIGGVGGVLGFFPLIIMLFLVIAFLEDSGYMARAAFVMDRAMSKVGLSGKSFIPMIVGFGCTVPAIYATRTLDNRKDRLITLLITPLMSCGARLPVYVLLIGAFFSTRSENFQANMLTGIYVLGILLAVLMALLFRKTILPGQTAPFVMELPPYRMPTLMGVVLHTWERGWLYLRKAGTIILAASIVMWATMTYPTADNSILENTSEQMEAVYSQRLTLSPGAADTITPQYEEALLALENEMAARDMQASVAGRFGQLIEPLIRPIGFDWRIGVSLLAGFVAKEVVVGTMGTIYSLGGKEDEESVSLREKMGADPAYSPAMALAMMIFTLIYIPCMVALAAWHREAGNRWKWTGFLIAYTTLLAWVCSFAVYNVAPTFGIKKSQVTIVETEETTPWDEFLKVPSTVSEENIMGKDAGTPNPAPGRPVQQTGASNSATSAITTPQPAPGG